MATVLSVNVGRPKSATWAASGRTSIHKTVADGRVAVRASGIEGDQVSDTKHHGGIDQAVYAFAREDLDWWARELGEPIADGQFGENLTTTGIDVNQALIGERWRIGTVLLEIADVRIPCNDFKNWMSRGGYDARAWVKRFTAVGRPGPYLRVLEEGHLAAGDDLAVEHRPEHGVTVTAYFAARTTNRAALSELQAALR
ncbi:MAG: MOSC domain-containing protein [Nocardioides sp.]